ncbi:MAG: hypothetical protein SH857_02110 [Chitinophagales bacterium]|nr:hypothetical protein [Chitinophagales bacterium]
MKTKIILFGCLASCILLFAKCNQEVNKETKENGAKQPEVTQQNNSAGSADTARPMDTAMFKTGSDTVKVYHDYIKDHLDSLTRLIAQEPQNGEYYLRRGDLRIAKGNNAGGCEDYNKAKSLGIKNIQSLLDKNCK